MREFDVILFGATGFTGKLVAHYLAQSHSGLRWAIAGRRKAALDELADQLPEASRPAVVVADAADAFALAEMAARTRVVVTTAGPFALLGLPLVAACAAAGTHYADLTGEVTFVRQSIDQHHQTALASGARIVHCCGFDSIPSDLGTQLLIDAYAEQNGSELQQVEARFSKIRGGVSGGTVASALGLVDAAIRDPSLRRVLGDPYALTGGRRGSDRDVHAPGWDSDSQQFTAPFVMAAINSRIVRRSRLLLDDVPVEDFQYDERMAMPATARGAAMAVGVSAAMAVMPLLALSKPLRRRLAARAAAPGTGPSPEQQARGRFLLRLRGVAATEDDVDVHVTVRCDDADPGYLGTSRMLGETALCLAFDELSSPGGVTTPAAAMGGMLRARLNAVGITFSVDD